jgi:hypothetical protein
MPPSPSKALGHRPVDLEDFFLNGEASASASKRCIRLSLLKLINKNLSGAYIAQSEATNQHLQTRQWVK